MKFLSTPSSEHAKPRELKGQEASVACIVDGVISSKGYRELAAGQQEAVSVIERFILLRTLQEEAQNEDASSAAKRLISRIGHLIPGELSKLSPSHHSIRRQKHNVFEYFPGKKNIEARKEFSAIVKAIFTGGELPKEIQQYASLVRGRICSAPQQKSDLRPSKDRTYANIELILQRLKLSSNRVEDVFSEEAAA